MKREMCPADETLFSSHGASSDPRIGKIVGRLETAPTGLLSGGVDIVFLGVPEDRGIAGNFGGTDRTRTVCGYHGNVPAFGQQNRGVL